MLHERRAPEPIVPFALWRMRSVVVTNLGAFCIGVVLSCITLFLPAYVQGVLGYGARIAAVRLCGTVNCVECGQRDRRAGHDAHEFSRHVRPAARCC